MTPPNPTNEWTRAEMVEHILSHLWEAQRAMQHMPDMNNSDLHKAIGDQILELRNEARNLGYWRAA